MRNPEPTDLLQPRPFFRKTRTTQALVMAFLLTFFGCFLQASADEPLVRSELVFSLRSDHNHAPGIVECPNGDLLLSWYRGSGERTADDAAIYGARLHKGSTKWSPAFVMADHSQFPDCNNSMVIDSNGQLWLFWSLILNNEWESAITQALTSHDYLGDGAPKWSWQSQILLQPADFKAEILAQLESLKRSNQVALLSPDVRASRDTQLDRYIASIQQKASNKLYQRLGWQPRCKPIVLRPSSQHPNGRMLVPLYSDTFSLSIMAISDDNGRSWTASKPLMAIGTIQPTVLQKNDGTLVAFLRENGWSGHVRTCESQDEGDTWGPVKETELPNPNSSVDAVRLANGDFCLLYNDTSIGRNSLAVAISQDEGKTWKWTRHLEKNNCGAFHYPCVIQGRDGTIHAAYSYSAAPAADQNEKTSIKHVAFNEAWVKEGDKKGLSATR